MYRSALFLTLAAVALGASARLNGDAQANPGNLLSPPSIAARSLDNIDVHLFERNFIEATQERRRAMPDFSQVGQIADIDVAGLSKFADASKLTDETKLADDTKVADVAKVADASKLNRRKVIDVKLRRREDVDAHAHANVALKRRRQDLENIVHDADKLIDVKLLKRADINEDVNHMKAKVQELVKLDRRLDLGNIVGNTHALIDVKLFRRHEEVDAVAKAALNRRSDLENIVGDAHKLIDEKLRKRADINEDVDNLKNKIDSLVKLDRRDGAHKLIDVKLLRRHEQVDAHAHFDVNLERRHDLENIVGDAHKLIDVRLLKRGDIKDDLNDLKAKVDELVQLDRRGLNIGAVVQMRQPITVTLGRGLDVNTAKLVSESEEGRLVKRKRVIKGTRIIPRSNEEDYDDDNDNDNYEDDGENLSEDVETQDMRDNEDIKDNEDTKDNKDDLSAADSKKNSGASALKSTGLSLVGALSLYLLA
ncbi:hypothetical protein BGZ59_002146 [Podila verticillata]|nr:hypothetical protein BGZ59_002146 [Podila verticillata]